MEVSTPESLRRLFVATHPYTEIQLRMDDVEAFPRRYCFLDSRSDYESRKYGSQIH